MKKVQDIWMAPPFFIYHLLSPSIALGNFIAFEGYARLQGNTSCKYYCLRPPEMPKTPTIDIDPDPYPCLRVAPGHPRATEKVPVHNDSGQKDSQTKMLKQSANTAQFLNAAEADLLIVYQTLVGTFSRGGLGPWFWQVSTLMPVRREKLEHNFQQDGHLIYPFSVSYGIVSIEGGTDGFRR